MIEPPNRWQPWMGLALFFCCTSASAAEDWPIPINTVLTGMVLFLTVVCLVLWRRGLPATDIGSKGAKTSGPAPSSEPDDAELATTILHNIGNILNSLRVSCDQCDRMLRATRVQQLVRAAEMLREHEGDLGQYLTEDPRGKLIPNYLEGSTKVIAEELDEVMRELEEMGEKINLMKGIIETQQTGAKKKLNDQTHRLPQIVEDALAVQGDALRRRSIEVQTDYGPTEPIMASRTQVIHILINLIKNSAEALENAIDRDRLLRIETRQEGQTAVLTVRDNGIGIEAGDQEQLFSYGFSTKETGHGFGLHFCWRTMKQLGGDISVASEGRDKGACFRLIFPTPAPSPAIPSEPSPR